jgi:hypothetical protein
MPIPVITNFSINDTIPFDTRLVATSSEALTNMLYKYEGLTTYRTDTKLNYTYNGSTWAVSSNGIYGGSGNLSSDTIINFGTVSASPLTSDSNRLTFRSYSGDDSTPNSVRVENYFIRHSSNFSGISYKNQLILSENDGQGLYNGPYIMYNPKPLFNSGIGGISFGVLAGTLDQEETPSYERMRIDGSGIIRFKPNATVNDTTKSVNIGIDSTNTRPFIGFNWDGSDVDTGTDASYVQFNDSVVSIHNFSFGNGTHSAIFSKGQVSINGALQVTGGLISTNKNISFGADDNNVYFVSSGGTGMKYDSSRNYAALTYRTSSSSIIEIIKWSASEITLLRPIIATGSATFTTYNTFNARYQTNIWDNDFNPDKVDSNWTVSPIAIDSNRQLETSNTVLVSLTTTTQFVDFKFEIKSPYTTVGARKAYVLASKPYDRYLYFYNDIGNAITHNVEMFLLIGGLDAANVNNWVKVGFITTGNQNNWNVGIGDNNTNYQIKFYSHSLIIPANMLFRIKFSFPYRFESGPYTLSHFVRTRIIRSGKWNLPGYTAGPPEAITQAVDPTP